METKASNRRGFFSRLAAVLTGGAAVQSLMARQPMAQDAPQQGAGAQPGAGAGQGGSGGRGRGGRGGGGRGPMAHNGVIYIAGIGAHIPYVAGQPQTTDIAAHTTKVMDQIKRTVESGGGTMDSILKLDVYLASMYHYEPMNQVYQTYFPNGGPARTTVVVAGIPDDSLLEISGIAAVVNPPAQQ
jgi:enamine deaminase RidA (YjgF/YER057c/UK114 family)